MSGCPRVEVQATALQLLQILDKRFFGTMAPPLHGEKEKGKQNNFIIKIIKKSKLHKYYVSLLTSEFISSKPI